MVCCDIRRPACQSDLYRCRSPWNKIRQLPFTDAKKWLMHLKYRHHNQRRNMTLEENSNICGINITLNDVQSRYITCSLARCCRHHSILRLKQSTHYVEDGCSANGFDLTTSQLSMLTSQLERNSLLCQFDHWWKGYRMSSENGSEVLVSTMQ